LLEPNEREAVLGDLAERGAGDLEATRELLGLVARRQIGMWTCWRPWLALLALALPFSMSLTLQSRATADLLALTFLHNLHSPGQFPGIMILACWSWIVGFAIGALSRRATAVNVAAFCLLLLLEQFAGVPLVFGDYHPNGVLFPFVIQLILVLLPAVWGMWQGFQAMAFRAPVRAALWLAAMLSAVPIAWIGLVWLEHITNHRPTAVAMYNNLLRYPWLGFASWWPVLYWIVRATVLSNVRAHRFRINRV
jgi:hypothetical protein